MPQSRTTEDLPDGDEIETPHRNSSVSSLPLPSIISHPSSEVSTFSSLNSEENHHQMSFHKRYGLLPKDNRLTDEKNIEQQDQKKQLDQLQQQQQQKQQQHQQPENQKVNWVEINRDNKDGTANGFLPEPPPQAGHSLNHVSKIVSDTLREVFPEFSHSLQDFLESHGVHTNQMTQQEVRKSAGPGGGRVSTRLP